LLIDVVSPDTIDLGPDTAYCGGFSRVLSAGFANAIWSTGATGAQITVTAPGTYQVQVTNVCGTATASITLTEKPIPMVDLGNDTLVCLSSVITLNAGNAGGTYLWQDGSSAQTYVVNATGTYAVSVTVNGCTGADSLTITFITAPAPFSLGKDTTICAEAPLTLDAYQPYTSDSINITVDDCICRVNIPTAFSPNKDGKNDTYGGIAWCIPKNYLLEIFDRWGQKLFTSTSIFTRWDGTYNNREQPIGVYVYYMKYTDPYSNIEYTQSGNVTLVR
jgi:gliding motility-associated-like protein